MGLDLDNGCLWFDGITNQVLASFINETFQLLLLTGGMFPLWTLKASRVPIAEIISKSHAVDYYPIDKIINNQFFIIKHIGIFHFIPDHAKILDGKVRIYQFVVDSVLNVDPIIEKDIYNFCKHNKFERVLPLMLEQNPSIKINESLSARAKTYLENFTNAKPEYYLLALEKMELLHEETKKWRLAKVFPKIEAKMVLALLIGGAVAIAIIVSVLPQLGNMNIDGITPKFLKGEFLLGTDMWHNFLFGLKSHFLAGIKSMHAFLLR